MDKTPHDIIIKPIITEKSMDKISEKKYSFKVLKNCNKIEIKNAIEKIFNVKVKSVNTINVKGKLKRRGKTHGYTPDIKKAIVTLTEDSKTIEFFESMS